MIPPKKPDWLKATIPSGSGFVKMNQLIQDHNLHTVCEEARCPNKAECWSAGIATLMILGDTCTRACSFCNVKTGRPASYDREEPLRVLDSVKTMNLKYLTLTSVDRDDLEDLGAEVWAETLRRLKAELPTLQIEILIPDFQGNTHILDIVLNEKPDVLNHNMETVPRLQKQIRKFANWKDSLKILQHAKSRGFKTKTGMMLGLGETDEEIISFIKEMAAAQIDILTLGQYLQPSLKNPPVQKYYHPKEFKAFRELALQYKIPVCESGPFVRSSYHAEASATI
jgi:lipoic acid synthetase